jgi:hypothetical protein
MATTIQDVLDLARLPLNDAKDGTGSDANCRYTDATLLKYTLNGLLTVYRRRPDLFFGSYANPPLLTWPKAQPFPLPDEYVQVLADWVSARAEVHDDEAVNSNRAALFLQLVGKDVG